MEDEREQLTPREWQVLALLREGLTNEQIAERLGISRDGVKYHVSEILSKLGLRDRVEAARWYSRATRTGGVLALLPALLRPSRLPAVSTVVAGGAVAGVIAVVVALVALLAGVLIMSGRDGDETTPATALTGDSALDEVIDDLLHAPAEDLAARFPGVPARDGGSSSDAPVDDWPARLAAAERELYAVFHADPQQGPFREVNVVLSVATAGGDAEGWQFGLLDGELVDVTIGTGSPPSAYVPSLARAHDDFIVLPPEAERPSMPPAHSLDVRTGDPGVDRVLDALQAGDLAGLAEYVGLPCNLIEAPRCPTGVSPGTAVEVMPVRNCRLPAETRSPAGSEAWLEEVAAGAAGLHAVAVLPAGVEPAGDHLILVLVQEAPYRWEARGLVERNGAVAGLLLGCGSDEASILYPPAGFLVAPPVDAGALDPDRRSGLPVIDAFLDALAAGDIGRLTELFDYTEIGCVAESLGIGTPPICQNGETDGTIVEALPGASCEGYYLRREEIPGWLDQALLDRTWSLYAVEDRGASTDTYFRGSLNLVLVDVNDPTQALAITFTDNGPASFRSGCGPIGPGALLGNEATPRFLLPPP